MTLRKIYQTLRSSHLRGQTSKFPIYLNLRDHYGQIDPAEILSRHAMLIGFAQASHLVRAWRAGYVHLLLDGFDEVSPIAIQGLWRKLRDNRYRAMEAVRRLIRDQPTESGILLAGRAHFFDNSHERHKALDSSRSAIELSLSEFTDDQINTYFQRAGISSIVPSWLPSRPLLIGYLVARGLLGDVLEGGADIEHISPHVGWDLLLERITSREAEIEAGIDGGTVRRILERLATKARASQDGLGSLSPDSVIQAFNEICGYNPDERGMILLQRLPGLGVDREEENSRIFIDESLADACRAGDLVAFVDSPFDFSSSVLAEMESSIGRLGIEVAAGTARAKKFSEGKINAALMAALQRDAVYLSADICRLLLELGCGVREELTLKGILIPYLDLGASSASLSKLHFQDCWFNWIGLEATADDSRVPSFHECFVYELEGRVSSADLPSGKFDDKCVVETERRRRHRLALDLPLGTRVCITKLYERAGSGRKENARGAWTICTPVGPRRASCTTIARPPRQVESEYCLAIVVVGQG